MDKNRIEQHLRRYVKENLSPGQDDIQFVAKVYKSFTDILGSNNCVQIGSFPRYTAIKPLHDLDILYKLGKWKEEYRNPKNILEELAEVMRKEFINPTNFGIIITVQSHSISIQFMDGENEFFAVDIVPAMLRGTNEYGKDTFYVPEIIKLKNQTRRKEFYSEVKANKAEISWIKTDPLGYIEQASIINDQNPDFRKSVKFIKGWKNACKEKNENFKLKSFHLEQLITNQLKVSSSQTIFDTIFQFLTELKDNIKTPCIQDRADDSKFIDQYIEELNESEIKLIHQALDSILKSLEEFTGNVSSLINSGYYKRGNKEEFLFDRKIPVLIDDSIKFTVDGLIKNSPAGQYKVTLSKNLWRIERKNSIRFFVSQNDSNSNHYLWKIKNDENCEDPRGDLSDNFELEHTEDTLYYGDHYAITYLISNNVCISKARANVIIKKPPTTKNRYHR